MQGDVNLRPSMGLVSGAHLRHFTHWYWLRFGYFIGATPDRGFTTMMRQDPEPCTNARAMQQSRKGDPTPPSAVLPDSPS